MHHAPKRSPQSGLAFGDAKGFDEFLDDDVWHLF
jgi:hypothetical protein